MDRDLTGAIGGGSELLHRRFIGCTSRCDDIEVAQHLLPVDADVEDALACGCPVGFGKVQAHCVRLVGRQTGNSVAEVAVAVALVDRLGCGIAHAAGVDSIGARRS